MFLGVRSVGGDLNFHDNPSEGFALLSGSLQSIAGNVDIYDNAFFQEVLFDSLSTVGGSFRVRDMPALEYVRMRYSPPQI